MEHLETVLTKMQNKKVRLQKILLVSIIINLKVSNLLFDLGWLNSRQVYEGYHFFPEPCRFAKEGEDKDS